MTTAQDPNARLLDDLRRRGVVRDARVLAAMGRVRRDAFLSAEVGEDATRDAPVPIGEGQTMSAPHMVAGMAEALDVRDGHRVLEVGGGSGYHAAVLAVLAGEAGHVWSVERLPGLAAEAERHLARAGLADRVTVRVGDGARGVPDKAPFHRVSMACAVPRIPGALLDQLAPGGLLVAPVGSRDTQTLMLVHKDAAGGVREQAMGAVRFVPLVGPEGFPG